MTISSVARKAGPYTGNGTTTSFAFGFKVFAGTDLRVIRRTSTGVQSNLVLGTDYNVSLAANQDVNPGGTINLTAGLASGTTLTIVSNLDYTQPTKINNQSGFFPGVINNALDRLAILILQLRETLGRSLSFSPTVDTSSIDSTLPAPEAGRILGWNTSGTGLKNYPANTPLGGLVQEQVDEANANATNALNIATSAATNASAADNKATNALAAATAASTAASNAQSVATGAGQSAASANAAATAAAASVAGLSTSEMVIISTANYIDVNEGNSTVFVAPTAGTYLFLAQCKIGRPNAASPVLLWWHANGQLVELATGLESATNASLFKWGPVMSLLGLAAGGQVFLTLRSPFGGEATIQNFRAIRIR
jgi:hypothetical protein